VELEEDGGAPVASTRPPRRFRIRIRRVGQDIIPEELFRFLNARASVSENCLMGKFSLFFSFNNNESHNILFIFTVYLFNK
jgi:hypothetical protein